MLNKRARRAPAARPARARAQPRTSLIARAPLLTHTHPPGRAQLWEVTKQRALKWGGLALFWGAFPLVLLLLKGRRGLSWGEVAAQALRLPFCD